MKHLSSSDEAWRLIVEVQSLIVDPPRLNVEAQRVNLHNRNFNIYRGLSWNQSICMPIVASTRPGVAVKVQNGLSDYGRDISALPQSAWLAW